MNSKHAGLAIALAAVLSAPAFAQSGVTSSTGAGVSSSSGVLVTPGVPAATVVVAPSAALPAGKVLPGGTVVQASSTTTMGGPAPGIKETRTVTTTYWANVPAGVERRADFQRWTHLK